MTDIVLIPAQQLRIVANNIEKFWGPLVASDTNRIKVIPEDDHTMKVAKDDALSLREVADLLEK